MLDILKPWFSISMQSLEKEKMYLGNISEEIGRVPTET